MRRLVVLSGITLGLIALCAQAHAAQNASMMPMPMEIARGRYLVGISGCMDCHGAQLMGGSLFFQPAKGVKPPTWAPIAPKIAGLPMFKTNAEAVTYLKTGVMPDGSRPRIPMPQMQFNDADAKAVVAYLRSK